MVITAIQNVPVLKANVEFGHNSSFSQPRGGPIATGGFEVAPMAAQG